MWEEGWEINHLLLKKPLVFAHFLFFYLFLLHFFLFLSSSLFLSFLPSLLLILFLFLFLFLFVFLFLFLFLFLSLPLPFFCSIPFSSLTPFTGLALQSQYDEVFKHLEEHPDDLNGQDPQVFFTSQQNKTKWHPIFLFSFLTSLLSSFYISSPFLPHNRVTVSLESVPSKEILILLRK